MNVSAGMLGIKEALRHSVKEMGIMRSMRALLEMNQEKGFRQIAQWKGTVDLKSTPGSGIGKGRTVVNDHSFAQSVQYHNLWTA